MAIEKKLHYVWVGGGKFTPKMEQCMSTWRVQCPDYEVIEWNEKNFDMTKSPILKKAWDEKNWSLISDIMRAYILYENGGIYIDTDIEILKPLDSFLTHKFFMGYDNKYWVNTAIIGASKGHEILKPIIDLYSSEKSLEITNFTCIHIYSALLLKMYGIKPNGKTVVQNGVALYDKNYFYPLHYLTHKLKLTPNSYVIHRCSCSWHTKTQKVLFKIMRYVHFIFGNPIFEIFEKITARKIRRKVLKMLE
jgi:mannosyltransferase OCH1-like enzyme